MNAAGCLLIHLRPREVGLFASLFTDTRTQKIACSFFWNSRNSYFSSVNLGFNKMGDEQVQEIAEGKAKVLLPKSVFYNPVQEFNRDLTISIISQFAEDFPEEQAVKAKKKNKNISVSVQDESENVNKDGCKTGQVEEGQSENTAKEGGDTTLQSNEVSVPSPGKNGVRIFEGLAASGLRSIRFGLEIPGVQEVIANDFDKTAVSFIDRNIARNNLSGLVKSSYGDASMIMYQNKDFANRFDVIDLDPYGSAAQFLDSAVQAVQDGGLLCVTCTDAAVLCGNAGETCFAKYGSLSLRGKFCHEMALRVLLHSIGSHANRYSRYIVPLLSLSVDFYVRVFVRVFTSQKHVKMSVTQNSMVYHCVGCGTFALQQLATAIPTKGDNHKFAPGTGLPVGPTCEHCGHKHQIGGPIWSAPIHDVDFLDKMLKRVDRDCELFGTGERMIGMLNVAREELQDIPLYYVLDDVCNVLHCSPPNMLQMRSALLNAGYRVSLSHAAKNSYKTDAPAKVIWDIMRCWVKDHPVSAKRLTEGSVALCVLQQPPSLEASFLPHPDANPTSRQKGLVRWQQNPEPEWGPKPRARRNEEKEAKGVDGEKEKGETEGKRKCEEDAQQSSKQARVDVASD